MMVMTSLRSCQNAVKVETANYIKGKEAAIAACLQRISIEVVKKNGAGDVGKAATTCVAQFRKISDSRALGKSLGEKFTAKIGAKCDPAQSGVTHTLGDILGTGAGVNEPLDLCLYVEQIVHGFSGYHKPVLSSAQRVSKGTRSAPTCATARAGRSSWWCGPTHAATRCRCCWSCARRWSS